MRKHFIILFGVLGAAITALFFLFSAAKAQDSGSWLDSNLRLEQEADTQSFPVTLSGYGNIDCSEGDPGCAVATPYGSVANGFRLNGTRSYYPVLSYLENRPRVSAVPNSHTVISYLTTPPFGLHFYFNHNFSASITKTFLPGTTQSAYQINQPPDGALADRSGNLLAADTSSMSFSANGRWMVVSIPNVAVARVNLQTFEVLPFDIKFLYGIGLPPDAKTAITNDGRYAVVASKNQSRFLLYDLETCAAVPDSISESVSCQSRDLKSFMTQQVSGYSAVAQTRFLANDLLAIYAGYNENSTQKAARFLISNSDINSQIDYLALGESYISGEGAFNYKAGTDTSDNTCHLSLVSYPLLVGRELNYSSYNSIACSGAHTAHIIDTLIPSSEKIRVQAKGKDKKEFDNEIYSNFLPGYRAQVEFVSRYRPKVMNLSIVGNDIGFSKIVTKCAAFWNTDNCYESYEDRVELVRLINSKFSDLVATYTKIKNETATNSRIYVIGYPQIAKTDGDCGLNVRLSDEEAQFAELLIEYLNKVIAAAADRAGVYYVDTHDALDGHRLCEAQPGSVAMNGLTAGTDAPVILGGRLSGPLGNESYHPNDLGHRLLKIKILAATNNLTNPMPTPNPNAAPPSEAGLEVLDVPRQNRPIAVAQYNDDMSHDILFQGQTSELNIRGLDHSLNPGGTYKAELHSEPVQLGNFTASSSGDLNTRIQIPAGVPVGLHTLHVYGTNLAGENIDIYKDVYIAVNIDDYDGDGIDNNADPCFFIEPAGQDFDQDGIDDGCDGVINQPPPPTPEPQPEEQPTENDPAEQLVNPVLGATANQNQPPNARPVNPVSNLQGGLSHGLQYSGSVANEIEGSETSAPVSQVQPATTKNPSLSNELERNSGFTLKASNLIPWPAVSAAVLGLIVLVGLFWKKPIVC